MGLWVQSGSSLVLVRLLLTSVVWEKGRLTRVGSTRKVGGRQVGDALSSEE